MRDRPNNNVIEHTTSWLHVAVLAAICVAGFAFGDDTDPDHLPTPRQLYNEGTARLREGKLREAESRLQSAVATQDERVQVAALYNLGHVRFQDGEKDRTNAPASKPVREATDRATQWADDALRQIDAALPGSDVRQMVEAYKRGRGARKELKSAIEAVQKAMDAYGAVLTKWRRSSGDFHSAHELQPSNSDAQTNGELVDRAIAKLMDEMKQAMMMQGSGEMTEKREELRKKMAELKKKIPGDMQDQIKNPGGDEEEDEDGAGQRERKEPKPGQEEGPNKPGREIKMTAEDAARLLGMLKLDADRKLSIGGTDETSKPQNRKGRDW